MFKKIQPTETIDNIQARKIIIKYIHTIGCSDKKIFATAKRACFGHGNTQSIEVLPISPGKFRQLFRRASPDGDIHKTT